MCRLSLGTILWDWWENDEIDCSRVNSRNHNLLVLAACAGCLPICKKLVERGMDVNARLEGHDYGTALVAAASMGHVEVTKYLVQAGADVNMLLEEREGKPACALEAAIHSGSVQMLKFLVKEAHADLTTPFSRESTGHALGEAAMSPGVELMKVLLEAGADVNMRFNGHYAQSPLQIKVRNGELESVKYLVEAGADINMQLPTGKYGSALAEACLSTPEMVKYLLGAGADVNMSLKSGRFGSALAAAAYEGAHIEIVKSLVEAGADINKPLEYGDYGSALEAAGAGNEYGDYDVFGYLIDAGADVNMPLEHGQFGSALAATAWTREFYRLEALFKAGVDVNMILKGRDFGSALAIVAAFQNGDGTVKKMLEGGADANVKHPVGRYGSPLIAAAAFGQIESVECLIGAGADVNLKFDGLPYATALQAAKANMSQEDKAWLLRYCKGNEEAVEEFAEDWEEQKPAVVEMLQQHGATD